MQDEGIFGSTARDIANGVFKPSVFAQGVDTFPVLSSIWQGWVMRIFGVNIWGWRFGSVLPGVMSIIPLYLLARDAFNRRIAIISSVVLLAIPYFLVYSRLGYTNIQPLFLVTLTLYLLFSGLRKTSSLYLYLAGCAAGLGFYTYFSGRSAFLIAILFIVLMWLTKKYKFWKLAYAISLFVLGAALVTAPYIIYGINQNPQSMVYRIFLSFFNSVAYGSAYYPNTELVKYAPIFKLGETELFFNPKIYLVLFLRGLVQTLLPYQKSGMLWGEHYLACPLAGTFGAVFYIIGIIVSLKNAKQSRFQLVILWFFTIAITLSALNTFPPREDHMVPIIPALALLTGFGLDAITETITSIFSWFKKHKNVILVILLAPVIGGGWYDYFVTGPYNFHQRPEDIMSWAGLGSQGESFLYVYEVPIRPDFVPYVMFEFRKDIQFKALQISEFMQNNEIIENGQKTIIFYPPEIDSMIRPILQAHWGNNLISKIFLDSDGHPVLMAGMNIPFTFERDRAFLSTLTDAFHQIPFVILLIILLTLLVLAIFLPPLKIRLPALDQMRGSSK
jgi:4-amino-4-deoxy-L-arabinose transferase-like glycosyltransferase